MRSSRAPGSADRHAPPAPYKGMQLKRRVHNRQTPQKDLQTDSNHVRAESELRSTQQTLGPP